MGESWQGEGNSKGSFPWADLTHFDSSFGSGASKKVDEAMRKIKRSDLDFLLGAADYEPGLIDAFGLTLLFVIFAIAFDHPI
jgi:hypothetical protein